MRLVLFSLLLTSSLSFAQSSGSQSGASSGSNSGEVTCYRDQGSTICNDENGNKIPVGNSPRGQSGLGSGNGTTSGSPDRSSKDDGKVTCQKSGETIICKNQNETTIPVNQSTSNKNEPCYKQCRDGFKKHGCESCLKNHPETYQLHEGFFGSALQPCQKECKKGTKKPACLKCLQANPDIYTLDEKVFGHKAQPCYSQCKEGLEKNGCAVCIIKNPKTFQLGAVSNEFSDCQKSDDLQSITCPEGRYVKDGSVVDSLRESNVKESSTKKMFQLKRNSAGQQ